MIDWKNLQRGQKTMALRLHWTEIKDYYDQNGAEATMHKYYMRPETLQRLLSRQPLGPNQITFSRDERHELLTSIAIEGTAEVKAQIEELKRQWELFVASVGDQLAKKFFLPLLNSKIEIPPELDIQPDHRLDMGDINGHNTPDILGKECINAQNDKANVSIPDVLSQAADIVEKAEGKSTSERLLAAITDARIMRNWQRAFDLLALYFTEPYFDEPEKHAEWEKESLRLLGE